MVKIRLSRIGKRHQPFYRIVVCDSHERRNGNTIEIIGNYNPLLKEKKIEIKRDRYDFWLSKGAQPSLTVRHLIK